MVSETFHLYWSLFQYWFTPSTTKFLILLHVFFVQAQTPNVSFAHSIYQRALKFFSYTTINKHRTVSILFVKSKEKRLKKTSDWYNGVHCHILFPPVPYENRVIFCFLDFLNLLTLLKISNLLAFFITNCLQFTYFCLYLLYWDEQSSLVGNVHVPDHP